MEDVTDIIFNKPWPVIIPDIATHDEEDIEMLGIGPPPGMSMEQYVNTFKSKVWITINRMVEIYKDDYSIETTCHEDSLEIYKVIAKHLTNWANVSDTSVNSPRIPIEDLLILDEMAEKLFNRNKLAIVESTTNFKRGFSKQFSKFDNIPLNGKKAGFNLEDYSRKDVISRLKTRFTLETLNEER